MDNLIVVLTNFIKLLGIQVSRQGIIEEVQILPSLPSMLSLSEVLNHWRISNGSYTVAFDKIVDVPTPFIAFTNSNGGEFLLVHQVGPNNMIVTNEYWNKHQLSLKEFEVVYTGFILVAEAEDGAGEVDYNVKKKAEMIADLRIPLLFLLSILIFTLGISLYSSYFLNMNWQIAGLTLVKMVGLLIVVLLLKQSFGEKNPFIQQLCKKDELRDCNVILTSPAAHAIGGLSWSEIGFLYFSGTLLTLIFNAKNPGDFNLLIIFNLGALPYTLFSIYYQWRVVKKWCVLCCSIQFLLWLEFFLYKPFSSVNWNFPGPTEVCNLLVCMSIPVIGWLLLKPYIQAEIMVTPLKQQLRSFKYDADLFHKLLSQEQQFPLAPEGLSITIGNPNAETTITVLSNPFCEPCAKLHRVIDGWLEVKINVRFQFIFSVREIDHPSKKEIVGHFLQLQKESGDTVATNALREWYNEKVKNYEVWSKKFQLKNKLILNHEFFQTTEQWCRNAEIMGTPTVFINGRKLPKNYQLEDVKYFI